MKRGDTTEIIRRRPACDVATYRRLSSLRLSQTQTMLRAVCGRVTRDVPQTVQSAAFTDSNNASGGLRASYPRRTADCPVSGFNRLKQCFGRSTGGLPETYRRLSSLRLSQTQSMYWAVCGRVTRDVPQTVQSAAFTDSNNVLEVYGGC